MSLRQRTSRGWCFHLGLVVIAMQAAPIRAWQAEIFDTPELDAGFRLLYELKPEEARAKFAAWQESHPQDALGVSAQAASYLFEECYRQGVLTSAYFLDDKLFLGKIALKPNPELRDAFFATDLRAQDLARRQLDRDPDDVKALFVMTLSLGMQADYASLIEKHQLESLGMIREADKFAKRLLAVNPDAADAYLTLGAANYIIGSLPVFKRFFLKFKGISGDGRAASSNSRLLPRAGVTCGPLQRSSWPWRRCAEKNIALARDQLQELVAEFPQNPLFASELAKLSNQAKLRLELLVLSQHAGVRMREYRSLQRVAGSPVAGTPACGSR